MQPSSDASEVLIVGAGPTGLTLACALARHGCPFRLIDQEPSPPPESRALAVHARTLEIFEDLGIVEPLIARGKKLHRASFHAGGEELGHVSFVDVPSRFPFVVSVPQRVTEELLVQRLEDLGGQVERPVRLTGFTAYSDRVVATLEDPTGGPSTVETEAAFLVGCDGAHSTVRKGLGIPFEGERFDEAFVLADAHLEWDLPDDALQVFFSEDGVVGVISLPGDKVRLVADQISMPSKSARSEEHLIMPRSSATPRQLTLERMQELLAYRTQRAVRLSDPDWLTSFQIHHRVVPRMRQGRVFLAGDAAHIHSPVGGQGMNAGIQDAWNLAWKLAQVLQGTARPELLDSFHDERHPLAEELVAFTRRATWIATRRGRGTRWLRDRALRWLLDQEPVRRKMAERLSMVGLGYRKSPWVGEHRAPRKADPDAWLGPVGGPRAGDRAPDGVVRQWGHPVESHLSQVMRGPAEDLLLFAGMDPGPSAYIEHDWIAREVRERFSTVECHLVVPGRGLPSDLRWEGSILLDPEEAVHETYGAFGRSLYLIRPDGHIGFRAIPADGPSLMGHLEKIHGG